jgi:hypothetical protein
MRTVLVVVANILREQTFQVALVNCDDVIQEITPATPYPTLCDSILPRTLKRGADRTHPQGSNRCGDFQSILGIAIKDDEPRSRSKWKCFSQLLDDPQTCRMLCDIEMQDAPTIVTDDEKAIEHAEGDRRNSEEVHRGNRFPVITDKGKPAPVGSGSLGARLIQREIVRSETSKPSMRSSPWMRGAPHVGFSMTIRKINSRTSFDVCRLPVGLPTLEISLQYKRNPALCQRTTVSGVTTMSACLHSDQNRRTATQKSLSSKSSLGRGRRRFRAASC